MGLESGAHTVNRESGVRVHTVDLERGEHQQQASQDRLRVDRAVLRELKQRFGTYIVCDWRSNHK